MRKRELIITIMAVVMVLALAGCGGGTSVEDDLAKDLGEDLAEQVSGADVEFEGTWPENMPADVPQFEKGNIINSTSLSVGGQKNISVILEDVKESEYDSYVGEVVAAGYEEFFVQESGGIKIATYQKGENALTLSFATKTGEFTIAYTGQ